MKSQGDFFRKGSKLKYDKKDATFQVSEDSIPTGMYQMIFSENNCESKIYVSKSNDENSFIPNEFDYTVGKRDEHAVIFLPNNSEVEVKSPDCKKPIIFKKTDKLNTTTKLPSEHYGLSKVPESQEELEVDFKKSYHSDDMYCG